MKKKTKTSKNKVNLFQSNSQRKGVGRKSLLFGSKLVMLAMALVIVGIAFGVFAILQKSRGSKAAILAPSCTKEISSGSINTAINSLPAGSTLCLNGGTYNENITLTKKITLTSKSPTNMAQLTSQIWFKQGSDGSRMQFIKHIGKGLAPPSILIHSNNVTIQSNDISNPGPRGICIVVGAYQEGSGMTLQTGGTVIDNNKIHNCGTIDNHDQGIYIANTVPTMPTYITNNYVYDNPMFGIQYYPNSKNTITEYNVFDNNATGVTFSSEYSYVSSNNVFRNNIVSNTPGTSPKIGGTFYGINTWWGSTTGSDNSVTSNCFFNNTKGDVQPGIKGVSVSSNIQGKDPLYTNRANKDFTLKSGSPCAGKGVQTSYSSNPTGGSTNPTTPTNPTPTTPQPNPNTPQPTAGTGTLNYKNFTPWVPYEGYDLKNDGKSITRENNTSLLIQYNKGTWANGHYGGYCITRPAGSSQPKSITFTAEYNSWGGNSLYFYPGNSNNKKWIVSNTYGVTKKSTETVALGSETKYCFGNVVSFPNGAAFSGFDNNRFLRVIDYTFNY